jgi:small subunit ribosomal protein S2
MKITLEQIIISGISFGHPTRRWNPKIESYTYRIYNGNHIINLVKTRNQLIKARKFITKVRGKGNNILFVGTKNQATKPIKERAQLSKSFFVRERWLGGTLTNRSTIQLSLLKLHQLEYEQKEGAWDLFQKKEATALKKRLERLKRYIGGLKGIRKLPGVVVVVGQTMEITAVHECRKLGIPIICRIDTDCDPSFVEIGVPINDDSTMRIDLFLKTLVPRINERRNWIYLFKNIQIIIIYRISKIQSLVVTKEQVFFQL